MALTAALVVQYTTVWVSVTNILLALLQRPNSHAVGPHERELVCNIDNTSSLVRMLPTMTRE